MIAPTHQPLLIQVLPRLTPGRCGVSDQAVLLSAELGSAFGVDSAYAVLNSNEPCKLPQAAIYAPPSNLLGSCKELTKGRPGAVLVHVSGYGYSADGAPSLLADALEKVKLSGQFRIAAYFHETFASGPPWRSAFWHTRRQQKALRRIIAQCELIVTNIGLHMEWLERESMALGGVPVERMPVVSPAGDTEAPLPFDQRNAAMLVFGLARTRSTAYQKLASTRGLLDLLSVREILDVGPDFDHPSEVNGIPVRQMGLLPMDDLPVVFAHAQFGFVSHAWFCLGKSSVFAGCCAQGIIPVLTGAFPHETDGLKDGVHVVTPKTASAVRDSGWQNCSQAAWSWYMGHRLRFHAERYARWISESQRGRR